MRMQGSVGSSLQAELDIYANGVFYKHFTHLKDDLRFAMITSRATVHLVENTGNEEGFSVEVKSSLHSKCDRCWHYKADVGASAHHPTICKRCADTVDGIDGENERRKYA